MTFQQMTNDILDWRLGKITMDELRQRYPTWQVKPDEAKFCVEAARIAGAKGGRG